MATGSDNLRDEIERLLKIRSDLITKTKEAIAELKNISVEPYVSLVDLTDFDDVTDAELEKLYSDPNINYNYRPRTMNS